MQIKNIFGKKINVLGEPLEPDEIVDVPKASKEIKKLINNKYLVEVQEDPKGDKK